MAPLLHRAAIIIMQQFNLMVMLRWQSGNHKVMINVTQCVKIIWIYSNNKMWTLTSLIAWYMTHAHWANNDDLEIIQYQTSRCDKILLIPHLHDTTGCQTGCQQPVWQPCWTNSHCSWTNSHCLFNRLSNRVVQLVWQPAVYTIQPFVKPVVKRVWQPVVSCKRGFRKLYMIDCWNGIIYRLDTLPITPATMLKHWNFSLLIVRYVRWLVHSLTRGVDIVSYSGDASQSRCKLVDNWYSISTLRLNAKVVLAAWATFVLARDNAEPSKLALSTATAINYWINRSQVSRNFINVHQMAPPLTEVADIHCSLLLIYRAWRDERLSWPGWLTYSGRFTHISGHPSATGRVQDREVSRPKTDVLPLCHATNHHVLTGADNQPYHQQKIYKITQNTETHKNWS